jgi:hypothetical protein
MYTKVWVTVARLQPERLETALDMMLWAITSLVKPAQLLRQGKRTSTRTGGVAVLLLDKGSTWISALSSKKAIVETADFAFYMVDLFKDPESFEEAYNT